MMNSPQWSDSDRKRLSGPALRAFFRIAEFWKLTDDEQMTLLALSDPRLLDDWHQQKDAGLPSEVLERMSYVIGIYKALHMFFQANWADEWVRLPNTGPLFVGRPPLDRMLSGNVADLAAVRQYLDAVNQGC